MNIKKIAYAEKVLLSLIVTCDEVLNKSGTVSTHSVDKKVTYKVNCCILSTLLLVNMCLLFLVNLAFNCYCYIHQQPKTKCLILYQHKTPNNNKSRAIDFKNFTYHCFDDIININDLDSKTIKVDKKSYKNIIIYCTG